MCIVDDEHHEKYLSYMKIIEPITIKYNENVYISFVINFARVCVVYVVKRNLHHSRGLGQLMGVGSIRTRARDAMITRMTV